MRAFATMFSLGLWSFLAVVGIVSATDYELDSLERRQSTDCPNGFTTNNGLNFTTYCGQNDPFNDLLAPFKTNSMEACMERCSRYGSDGGELCYGVAWNQTDTNCWLRNSTASTAGLRTRLEMHSALADRSQLEPLDTTCPYGDNSVQTLDTGEQFTIHCNKRVEGYDYCPTEYPECNPDPFSGFFHTDTLAECLQICREMHPLCRAVNWSPIYAVGYTNCWPKTGFENGIQTPTDGVRHLATLSGIGDTVSSDCPAGPYTSSNGKMFDIRCGMINGGTNITSVHRANISSCMDSCATSDQGCVGILFDSTLQGGYQNCYLQNSSAIMTNNPDTTYAQLSGTAAPTTSSSDVPSSHGGSSSSSKAWIAGVAVGGVAAICLLAGGFFWWRRRKANGPRGNPPQYHHELPSGSLPYLHSQATSEVGDTKMRMNELDAPSPAAELAGGGYGKVTYRQQSVQHVQELPAGPMTP